MLLLLVMLVTGPLLMVAGNHSVVDDGSGLICLSDDPSFNPTYVHFFIPTLAYYYSLWQLLGVCLVPGKILKA